MEISSPKIIGDTIDSMRCVKLDCENDMWDCN